MNNSAALAWLKEYAQRYELYVAEEPEDMAAQCQVDVSELPEGVTAMAFFTSHSNQYCAAFVKGDVLHRFGWEHLGEEEDDEVVTTIDELLEAGDPRDL